MATINGNNSNNSIYGTSAADLIKGLGGADYINGQGGNDTLDGGTGADKLDGGTGNDILRGGDGKDFVGGGTGDDKLYGDAGDDYLWDTTGFDQLFGGAGNDRLLGGEGRNNLYGEDGNDTLVAQLYGEAKSDVSSIFSGGNGTDTLHGDVDGTIRNDDGHGILVDATFYASFSDTTAGSGWFGYGDRSENWVEGGTSRSGGTFTGIEKVTVEPDTVLEYGGGAGNVTAVGGNLHDYFYGGSGNETFIGGKGDDLFHFGGRHAHGSDRIVGFNAAEHDLITTSWDEEGSYHAPVKVKVVEKNGHTIIASSELDGTVFHVLDIDAVGIQDRIDFGWIWS